MSLPLEGLKVLDLTRLLPGGFCSMLLADFGADVIKVEDTGLGDYVRWAPPYYEGVEPSARSALFLSLNRGKRSIRIDLKSAEGKAVLLRLVRDADVLLESFRPGVLDRLGVGYERLRAENPGLVYAAITGYGQDGPGRERSGHDLNYLGLNGILGLSGEADGPPVPSSAQIADLGGGALMAVVGVLIALRERDRSGRASSSTARCSTALCRSWPCWRGRCWPAGRSRVAASCGWPAGSCATAPTGVPTGTSRSARSSPSSGARSAGEWAGRTWPTTRSTRRARRRTARCARSSPGAPGSSGARSPPSTTAAWSPCWVGRGARGRAGRGAGDGGRARSARCRAARPAAGAAVQAEPHAGGPDAGAGTGAGEHTREVLTEAGYSEAEVDALLESGAVAGPAGAVQSGTFMA